MAKDYKNALICYEKVLSMPNIPNDIYVKTASNKVAALLPWDGTTRKMMEDAILNLEKALLMDMNPKLFYRYSEAREWLGDLEHAIQSMQLAKKLSPDSEEISKRLANLKQKAYFKAAQENTDERYRTKSQREVDEKFKVQYPGLNLNFIPEAVQKEFPPALVMQGHIERDEKKNYAAAASYYERAAKAGNPEGMLNLSDLYLKGLGVKRDVHQAVELLKKAVTYSPDQTGVVESYVALGLKYFRGTAVKQDLKEAKYWFQKSADLGFAEGELNLGCILKTEGRYADALETFKSASAKGCARAWANIGDFYRDGIGVKKNLDKARQMYAKAVEYGLSMNIEEELKKFQNFPSIESWFEQDEEMAKIETMEWVNMTEDALQDLEYRANDSDIARSILVGWQNYQQGVRCLNTMENESHDDYILEMFSSAIQICGHFLQLGEDTEHYFDLVIESVLEKKTAVDPVDLAVCGFYSRYPPSDLPRQPFRENWYLAARSALELNKLGEQKKALDMINWSIAKNPKNPDLRFYKARILGDSIDSYVKFLNMSSIEHYWRPRAYYCIAEILMKTNQIEKALNTYNTGTIVEKKQLQLFQKTICEEKRVVAAYLLEHRKLPRCPSILKKNDVRRRELLIHHHNAIKSHMPMLLGLTKHSTVIKTTLNEHRRQPDPTAKSGQIEFFFNDLDLTKERIYEGFIDCLILAPPLKNFGIVTVVEDKNGSTCRALLYDDISVMHIKVGQWVRIYNPYIRIAADHRSAIKVTNQLCFEVLQYEDICHCCTEANDIRYFCEYCEATIYCSKACFEKHYFDYQHNACCRYLNIPKNSQN